MTTFLSQATLRERAVSRGWTPEETSLVATGWDESMAARPPGRPDFLNPEQYIPAAIYCGVPPEVQEDLRAAATLVAGDSFLCALAWHAFRILTTDEQWCQAEFEHWPDLQSALGDAHGHFYLLVALGLVPTARRRYGELGVDEETIRDTLTQLSRFIGNHRIAHGRAGLLPNQLRWTGNYYRARLFRLGRMEFKVEPHVRPVRFYRNRRTGRMIGFAPAGACYDAEGFSLRPDADPQTAAWRADFSESGDEARGTPLSPLGFSTNREKTLSAGDWACVLKAGDPVIDLHIPPGGEMTPEACRNSFARAFEFFPALLPETAQAPIVCSSWIFNTQLEAAMPNSNMARLMREVYLYPVPSSGMDGFSFVFWKIYPDLSRAPRDTRLQRAMLDILASGRPLRSGGMALFRQDLSAFGAAPYRCGGE